MLGAIVVWNLQRWWLGQTTAGRNKRSYGCNGRTIRRAQVNATGHLYIRGRENRLTISFGPGCLGIKQFLTPLPHGVVIVIYLVTAIRSPGESGVPISGFTNKWLALISNPRPKSPWFSSQDENDGLYGKLYPVLAVICFHRLRVYGSWLSGRLPVGVPTRSLCMLG